MSFGNVTVGQTDAENVTVTNTGTSNVVVSSVSITGNGFSATTVTNVTLDPNQSMTIKVSFAPTGSGVAEGKLSISSNASDSVLQVAVSGTGVIESGILTANEASLSFGNVSDGTTNSLPASVENTGNANITISSISVTGAGFSASGISNGTVLGPGQSASLTVTFAPTAAGSVSGAGVSIASNASDSPTTIALSGAGTHVVKLQWAPSSTASVTYNVFRGITQGGEGPTPLNPAALSATSYTDTNVVAGQTYFYDVKAINADGSSGPSTEVQINVPSP